MYETELQKYLEDARGQAEFGRDALPGIGEELDVEDRVGLTHEAADYAESLRLKKEAGETIDLDELHAAQLITRQLVQLSKRRLPFEIRRPTHEEFSQVLRLRHEELDRPFGLPEKIEPDSEDLSSENVNIVLLRDGKVVSTVRIERAERGVYSVRRMATAPEHQGKGYGKQTLLRAEALVKLRGAEKLVLHAREGAVQFYEASGYSSTGNVFDHDGFEHLEMVKNINE